MWTTPKLDSSTILVEASLVEKHVVADFRMSAANANYKIVRFKRELTIPASLIPKILIQLVLDI
jgi:hypothetical protein